MITALCMAFTGSIVFAIAGGFIVKFLDELTKKLLENFPKMDFLRLGLDEPLAKYKFIVWFSLAGFVMFFFITLLFFYMQFLYFSWYNCVVYFFVPYFCFLILIFLKDKVMGGSVVWQFCRNMSRAKLEVFEEIIQFFLTKKKGCDQV